MRRTTGLSTISLLALSLAATGCNSDAAPIQPTQPTTDPTINQIVTAGPIAAVSTDTLVYFSFTTGAVVPRTSDWDVAFRRYEVRLNGGVSGTKGVVGYSLNNNAAATNDQVLAFTAANTLGAFDSVRAARIPATSAFFGDRLFENATGYINFAGAPAANAAGYWKVRLAGGAYALVRATSIVLSGSTLVSVTFESRLQTGTTLGTAQQVTATLTGGIAAVSFAANAQVGSPSGCNWDLQVAASFAITVNAACNAGTYPGPSSPAFAAATSASDAPQYAGYLAGLDGPIPNSVTDVNAPFRYNLAGNNRLSPTFNTYLISTTGTTVYKLQVIDYYSVAGASGNPTIRYAKIR